MPLSPVNDSSTLPRYCVFCCKTLHEQQNAALKTPATRAIIMELT